MPYIPPDDREMWEPTLGNMCQMVEELRAVGNPGELNYIVSRIVRAWLGEAPRYVDFNEVIGALECAKLEVYRRRVAPYEERKCLENGDV